MAGGGLDEFGLIARHFVPLAGPGGLGLLDDAALLRPTPGMDLVLTKDMIVAGVHFLADDPPDMIAAKLLRVNLSDLAAKGARPIGYLLGLALPAGVDEGWIAAFARGLGEDQKRFGLELLGGDTTATTGPAVLSLTAIGEVPAGTMIRRSGARAGDLVAVSGTIGDGMLGLEVSLGRLPGLSAGDAVWLRDRYLRPQPRLSLGARLRGHVTAGADVSDGLIADLGNIARASGLSAQLALSLVPLSAPAVAALALRPELGARLASGGDDYELVVTGGPAELLPPGAAGEAGLTVIGLMVAGEPGTVTDKAGRPFGPGGYRHFAPLAT